MKNESKTSTELPVHNDGTPTFQGFLLADNDDEKLEADLHSTLEGRKLKDDEETKQSTTSARDIGRKVKDAEPIPSTVTTSSEGRKVNNAEPDFRANLDTMNQEQQAQKSRTGRTVKLSAKAREAMNSPSYQKTPSSSEQSSEIEDLIVQLITLLENWDKDGGTNVNVTQARHNPTPDEEPLLHEGGPTVVLATKINSANAIDHDQLACSTQFDVEEPETYNRAMQGPNAAEWARAMEEELGQLHKDEMEPGHRPLGGKWVYKIKRDVDGNIARFKARWVVKGYHLQKFGVDFDQTFAAVGKPMAFRVLIAIAAFFDLYIDQMDVKTAFL